MLKATAVRSPLPVMSSILPCPPYLPQVMQSVGGVQGQGVWGRGRGLEEGEGAGTFHPPCHIYTALPHGALPKRDFAQ